MAGIGTVMAITDKMSAPIDKINASLGTLTDTMAAADVASEQMLSGATINIENFNQSINQSNNSANGLLSTLRKVASVASVIAGVKMAANWIGDAIEYANTQIQSQLQLKTVLANVGAAEDAYDRVIKKAGELQKSSIYGDEAYIAGAAELATYMSDTDALLKMMDTLSNYATGMTGGQTLDAKGMTDMATGLGKALNGSYDALVKKGFQFTAAQKAVINGTATQAQIVEAVGQEYADMNTEMMAAQVLSDAINEAWGGLAENMANAPSGQIQQLANTWGDVKEVIGLELMPATAEFFSTVNDNMPTIQSGLKGVNFLLIGGIKLVNSMTKGLGSAAEYAISHIDEVSERVQGASAVFAVAGAGIINIVLGLVNGSIELGVELWNFLASFANFFANFLNDPAAAIGHLGIDLVDFLIGLVDSVAGVIDTVFGSDLSSKLDEARNAVTAWGDDIFGERSIDLRVDADDFKILDGYRLSYEQAALAGADWGRDWVDSFTASDRTVDDYLEQLAFSTNQIAENTGVAAGVTMETIAWLKDIAERDAINQFTTAAINVSLGGVTNNVTSGVQDLDGFVNQLAERIGEEIETTAAGYAGAY